MTRKSEISRSYAPDWVSLESLAYRLDLSPTTVQDYVKAGILPRGQMIGVGSQRWEWSEVQAAIKGRTLTEDAAGDDDIITDIRKAKAARDRAS